MFSQNLVLRNVDKEKIKTFIFHEVIWGTVEPPFRVAIMSTTRAYR